MEQQSYLTEIAFNPVLASTGKRFLNFLIDSIIFDILSRFISAGIVIAGDELYMYFDPTTYDLMITLIDLVIYLLMYVLFFFLSELIFKGRTIGKLITGTKAITKDGTTPSAKTLFLRALSRSVPFEPFSAFGNPSRPWHDRWTKTYVIDVKKTAFNDLSFQQ